MNLFAYLLSAILYTGIYSFQIPAADGGTINLADHQGKRILIVNIASGSKLVSQLNGLEALHQLHKDSLTIIAVPSNSFGKEPLTDAEISTLLKTTYDVHFLIAAKANVTGSTKIPLYGWLGEYVQNGVTDNPAIGDFQKYLVGKDGSLIGFFAGSVDPSDELFLQAITGTL